MREQYQITFPKVENVSSITQCECYNSGIGTRLVSHTYKVKLVEELG